MLFSKGFWGVIFVQLINSQYRIKEILQEDKYGSKILAEDIHKDNQKIRMRLINKTPETEAFIDYMKVNFFDYTNLIHPNIYSFYYFNKVRVIDARPVISNKFYYTYEDVSGRNLFEYAEGKEIEVKLELYIQLLSAFKYLHLKGFVYCSINPKEILVVEEEEKAKVKVASFPYSLNADNKVIIDKDNLYLKAPETLKNGIYDKGTDIYLLGIILYHLFTGENINKSNVVLKLKNKVDPKYLKINNIIEKCITINEMRYNSIDEILRDINEAYNKTYSIIDKKYIETLPAKPTKLVARENVFKRLIDNIKGYLYEDKPMKFSAIIGDYGTGKGALLDAFMVRLGIEGEYVAYTVLNEKTQEDYFGIKAIIRNILKYAAKDLVDKYFDQLSVLIPELIKNRNISYMADGLADEGKAICRLGNFILETSLGWPFIVIIKNFEYLDEKSKKVINYILTMQDKGKVCFVVTLHDEVLIENVKETLDINLGSVELDVLKLSKYSIYETAEAIRILLGMDKPPIDFAAKIYKETAGNPCLVHEMIHALFLEKHIYVDNRGKWVFNEVDFTKIHLSLNIIEIILNKIKNLEPQKKLILDIISIFSFDVPKKILGSMTGINISDLALVLENLVFLNILTRRTDEWGVSYGYNSMGVKKSVYEAIDKDILYHYHQKASEVLEKQTDLMETQEYKEELIYHMSKGGRKKDAIDHSIITSNDMAEKNLYIKAIDYLKYGLEMFETDSLCTKKIEIKIKLGDLYYKIGKYRDSLECYKMAEAMVPENKNLLADIYIKNIYVNYRLNDIRKCLKYSQMAKKIIKANKYQKGLYDLILALTDLMLYRRKIDTFIKIIKKVIKELNIEDKYYYGMFMAVYGKALIKKSRYEEAMDASFKSAVVLEELKVYEGLVIANNAIGAIYLDYYNEYKKAEEYFKKNLALSQEINNITHILLSYINLAEVYKNEEKHGDSLAYLDKALELAERHSNTYIKGMLYNNAAMINLELEDYIKYEEYMEKGKKVTFDNKDSGEVIKHYYLNKAIYFYVMGMYEKSKEHAEKAIEISKSWGISVDLEVTLVNCLCKIKLTGKMDFAELKDLCNTIFNGKSYKIGRLACQKIAELYAEEKEYKKAKNFLDLSHNFKDIINTPRLDIMHRYLSIITDKSDGKIEKLIALDEEYDYMDSNEIKFKIYKSIGLEYLSKGDTYDGLKNLITSFNFLRLLTDGVSKNFKKQFLESHGRNAIKEDLMTVSQKITGQKGLVHSIVTMSGKKENIESEINEYFDYKKFKDLLIEGAKGSKKDFEYSKIMLGKFLLELFDRISGFGIDIEDNIKLFVEAFMGFAQAKNGFLAITDENNEIQMLYANIKKENNDFYRYIVEKTKQKGDSILIPDVFEYKKNTNEGSLIPKDVAAFFSIPILASYREDKIKIERRKTSNEISIKGYLYIDTDSIINNFSEETGILCEKVSKISYLLIDNYTLKMVNAFDKLTKLYTRKYFENALANAMIKGDTFSIIMGDIDRFKAVNDRYGHQVGDEVLAKLSEIMLKNLRKTDVCARYGGEEFIMLLPSTDTKGAFRLAEKIRKKIESASIFSHHTPVTISMGVSTYPTHSTWGKDLIDKADRALYYAKESGRNNSKIYDESLIETGRKINKLAGIVGGVVEEDIERVETIIEVLDIQRSNCKPAVKMESFLEKALAASGAQTGFIFFIGNEDKLIKSGAKNISYNIELIEKCVQDKAGRYLIDWSGNVAVDTVTGMPDWQSVIIVPIMNYGKVNAVLYLSASLKYMEFEAATYNYINTLCKIIAPVFLHENINN